MKKKGNWNEENMKEALKQITEKKMTQKQAAETFHVPKTTLGDRYRALQIGETVTFTPQMGRFKMTFDKELEAQLVSYIKDLDKKFMPFSRSEFLKFSYDLAEHLKLKHRFNKEIKTAGKRFYYDFMARNPSLSLRSPESTSLQKALGFDRHQVDRFFNRYSELLMKYNFSANKIHNCDETGVPIVHDNIIKVISQKGKKQVSKITSAERGRNVTVLLSINAAGNIFVPPLFVYPKQRVDAILKKDAPPGSIFIAEESGWITAKAFLKWLELFVERTQPTEKEPVLLIVDGHASHKDLDVILFAKQHHVHMLSLLPHTTHKLQPLDRAVMQPFKAAYNQACSIWMRKFQPLKITLRDIAGLINTAYISICRMDLAQSAFECTGLWPFNPAIFTDLDFIPSEHFQQPESVATPVIYLPEFQEPSTSFVSEPTNINILFQSSPADEPSHFMEICPTDECSNLMEIVKIISPTANIEEMRKKKKQRKN